MYDHMLNGKSSRQRHQQIIQQARRDRLAQDVRAAHSDHKSVSPVRTVLIAVINMIVGQG